MMDRRKFIALSGSAAFGTGSACSKASSSILETTTNKNKILMHVGTQRSPTNRELLQFFKRHGVNNICGYPPDPGARGYWTLENLEKTRDLCEQHQISLDLVQLPFLRSSHVDRTERPAIMLADDPEREKDIDDICKMIRHCAMAGIPAIKYNMSLLVVLRTENTPGRGAT